LREDGWIWLLAEVAVIGVLSLLSMALDRRRALKNERAAATMPPSPDRPPSPPNR
jgi:hypothetical protein